MTQDFWQNSYNQVQANDRIMREFEFIINSMKDKTSKQRIVPMRKAYKKPLMVTPLVRLEIISFQEGEVFVHLQGRYMLNSAGYVMLDLRAYDSEASSQLGKFHMQVIILC